MVVPVRFNFSVYHWVSTIFRCFTVIFLKTVIILNSRTHRSGQTVQTQIRLLLQGSSLFVPRGAVWSGSSLFAIPVACL